MYLENCVSELNNKLNNKESLGSDFFTNIHESFKIVQGNANVFKKGNNIQIYLDFTLTNATNGIPIFRVKNPPISYYVIVPVIPAVSPYTTIAATIWIRSDGAAFLYTSSPLNGAYYVSIGYTI